MHHGAINRMRRITSLRAYRWRYHGPTGSGLLGLADLKMLTKQETNLARSIDAQIT